MDTTDALSHSRCRERRLNNGMAFSFVTDINLLLSANLGYTNGIIIIIIIIITSN